MYWEVCRTGKLPLRHTVKFAVSGRTPTMGCVSSAEQGHTRGFYGLRNSLSAVCERKWKRNCVKIFAVKLLLRLPNSKGTAFGIVAASLRKTFLLLLFYFPFIYFFIFLFLLFSLYFFLFYFVLFFTLFYLCALKILTMICEYYIR